jgi:HlyD family secretion protein
MERRRIGRAVRGAATWGALAAILVGGAALGVWALRPRRRSLEELPRGVVRRADLHVTLTTAGRVECPQQTVIECELERLNVASGTAQVNAGGASTILELVPEGTVVKRDDVLCRIDASDYEELVRQQEIKVLQARASLQTAELGLKGAELARVEYREGTLGQAAKDVRSRIVLTEADLGRQADRVAWTRRMLGHGYIAAGALANEELALKRSQINLEQFRDQERNLRRFGGPLEMRMLDVALENARAEAEFQRMRLEREESRLERFRRQVEYCTVRAPHDGIVVYANRRDRDPRIEVGALVRQKMNLFYLPDLSRMEVQAILHESVVDRLRNGMSARVRVEAIPKYSIEGHVVHVDPLPLQSPIALVSKGVVNYLGRVRLHHIPRGLLPGMTAEVEIETAQRPGALVIPTEALAVEGGQEVCYVAAGPDRLERRPVKLGQATRDLLEVTDGLEEGEQVVLDPDRIGDLDAIAADAPREEPSPVIGIAAAP